MQTMQSNTATATVVPAAGQDVFARLTAWATPVTKVDMSNLNFAVAQRLVASDATARNMLSQLLSNMAKAHDLQERAKATVRTIHSGSRWAHYEGEAIYDARKIMARIVLERDELRRETIAYARLVKQLKATATGAEYDKLAKQVADTKQMLDDKRAVHNAAMATAKVQLQSAEDELLHCHNPQAVGEVIELLQEQESDFGQARSIRKQLEVDLNAFEDYVASLG